MLKAEDYIGYVEKIVSKHYRYSHQLEDLIAVGTMAVVKWIGEFDEKLGAAPETYLFYKIRGEISDYLRKEPGPRSKTTKRRFKIIPFSTLGEDNWDLASEIKDNRAVFDINRIVELRVNLAKTLAKNLSQRDADILSDYAINCISLQKIANKYGISKNRVHQIVSKTMVAQLVKKEIEDMVLC